MCEKRARMGRLYQRYKNINLNKIQRSNEQVSQDKQSLERHTDSLKNKSPQICCIPHVSFGPSDSKTLFTWSGGPGLVGQVSFVLCPLEREKKETKPTRPGSPTPCKQALNRAAEKTCWLFKKKMSSNTLHSSRKVMTGSM